MRDPQIVDAQVVDAQGGDAMGSDTKVIDYDGRAISGIPSSRTPMPCPACGTPRQAGSRFCVACGVPFESPREKVAGGARPPIASRASVPPPLSRNVRDAATETSNAGVPNTVPIHGDLITIQCQSCGSEIDASRDDRSLRCPFCDSTFVIELSESDRTKQRPEFVIGFSVTREKAQELFFKWLGRNSWFRPGDLTQKAATDKQQGVYVPFWHFSMTAESRWSAQIGEYWYRTETYTVRGPDGKTRTETRTVRETEWWPLDGIFRKYYWGYMVSASKGLPQNEALAIQPYQLTEMVRYRPMYVAGWLTEEYSISREAALEQTRNEFYQRQARAIERFLPGDEHANLKIQTELEVGGTDLVLLPVHILSYRYRDKVFRFMVNGQTGKVFGEKPWSGARITAAVLAGAFLVLLLFAIIVFVTHPR